MTLDQFLAEAGLPAKHFAKAAGISAAQLSRIRHGHSLPSWKTAKKISELTNGKVSTVSLMEASHRSERK